MIVVQSMIYRRQAVLHQYSHEVDFRVWTHEDKSYKSFRALRALKQHGPVKTGALERIGESRLYADV